MSFTLCCLENVLINLLAVLEFIWAPLNFITGEVKFYDTICPATSSQMVSGKMDSFIPRQGWHVLQILGKFLQLQCTLLK